MGRGFNTALLLSFFAVAALCLAAGPSSAQTLKGDWPMANFDAQGLNNNVYETVLTKKSVKSLQLSWELDNINAGGNMQYSSPVVAGGVLYVAALDGHFYARDAVTGRKLWTTKIAGQSSFTASPAVQYGIVYISYIAQNSPHLGKLRALDASTGKTLWTKNFKFKVVGSPIVASGRVFQGGGDDRSLYAFDARGGALLWKSDPYPWGAGDLGTPAVANGVVYSDSGPYLTAYDAATGKKLWYQSPRPGCETSGSSVAVKDGNVLVNDEGCLSAFQVGTGAPEWSQGDLFMGQWETFAVAKSHIHVFDMGGMLHDIDISTGRDTGVQEYQIYVQVSPTIANGVLYAGNWEDIAAYDVESGALLWSGTLPENYAQASPVVANGMLYVLAGGSLYAYGLKN